MVRRSLTVLIVAGLLVASCSRGGGDDDGPTTVSSATSPAETAVTASSAPDVTEPDELTGDGVVLGLIEPSPEFLPTVFEATQRGVELAATDIADGGGVIDGPLTVAVTAAALDGTEAEVVPDAIDDGADVLVGPTGSTDAVDYREAVTDAEAISCSPTASVPGLTDDQDTFGLFRTALPDDVFVTYLADVIERRGEDGDAADWSVAIVARSDDDGLSVANGVAAAVQARGYTTHVIDYPARRVDFEQTVDDVVALSPDLTLIVSHDEGVQLATELVDAGIDPATMVGTDAFFGPETAAASSEDGDDEEGEALEGFTMIGAVGTRAFLRRLIDADPDAEVAGAAQAYDCAMVFSLAAQAVEDEMSESLSDGVREVTAGGVTCTTYADCLAKLAAGDDIDYDGVSGNLDIDENGDPTFARFTTGTIVDGEIGDLRTTDIDIAEIRRQRAAYASAAFNTKLQQALSFLGFYDGPIDGLDGPELTAALVAFQESVGLEATGVFDAATDEALRAALGEYADLLNATTSEIQVLLTELGFYDGPVDGVWSPAVTEAVRALQRDLGVPETGVFDAATLRAIHEQGRLAGSSATTVPTTEVPVTTAPPTTAPPVATTSPPTATTAPTTTAAPTTAVPTTAPATTQPTTTTTTTAPAPPPPTDPPGPTPSLDLFETLRADPDFSTFVDLALASGFDNELDRFGRFTVFAPTDTAFAALSDDELAALRNDPTRLEALLGYHIAEGEIPVADLTGAVETINGALLPVTGAPPDVTVDGAPISRPDIVATNGVTHGLSALLQPPAR